MKAWLGVRVFLAMGLVASVALMACARPTPTPAPVVTPTPTPVPVIKWRFNTPLPVGSYATEEYVNFTKRVAERTGGRLQISVHPGRELGFSDPEMLRVMKRGDIEMSDILYTGGDEPLLLFFTGHPFLFRKLEHAVAGQRAAVNILNREIEPKWGTRAVMPFWYTTTHIITKRPIETMADWKGQKLRGHNAQTVELLRLLGATPTMLAMAELYTAIQRGVIEGVFTSTTTTKDFKLYEVLKYVNVLNSMYPAAYNGVSINAFNALPPDVRQILTEEFQKTDDIFIEIQDKMEKEQTVFLREKGMIINTKPLEFWEEMRAIVTEPLMNTWVKAGGPVAEEMLAAARKAIGY